MADDPHINPKSGVWDDNYYAQTHGGGGGGGGGVTDYVSLAREQMKMMQEANKPYVEALQASIPTIGTRFAETGRQLSSAATNLKDRYDKLLSSITGMQQEDVGRAETVTSQELGRRGISTQGGLFGETINRARLPVNRAYAQTLGETQSSYNEANTNILNQLANLPISQTEAEQKVQQAIAQLQAGGNSSAISSALDIYKANLADQQERARLAAAQATNPLDEAYKALQIKQAQLNYDLAQKATNAPVATNTATTSPTQYYYGGYSSGGNIVNPIQSTPRYTRIA